MAPPATEGEDAGEERAARHPLRSALGLPFRPLRSAARFFSSRPFLLTVVVAAVAAGLTFGTMESLAWMETGDFCGRCHTMGPEIEAHARSSHETVECAECHVGEGLLGLAKAKIGGLRQTAKLLLGSYARPIPPAAHGLPSANETCGRCHDPSRKRDDLLVTRSHFLNDEKNTEQRIALVIRLAPDGKQQTSGIHWHVLSKVEYLPLDPQDARAREIAWVGVEKPDGSYEQFISREVIPISEQAGLRAAELRRDAEPKRMSCYDCHNRIGHEFTTPERALNQALAADRVSQAIPFVKKRGLETVAYRYNSAAGADEAIRRLAVSYHAEYPNVFLENADGLWRSLEALAVIYRQTSHPEMAAAADDYPNQLGHTDSSGCFRCHDGGHYKIVDGRLSDEAIPSRCSTCHTFPSVGDRLTAAPLGNPPTSHEKPLWVFEHKNATNLSNPTTTACGACHSQNYCTNCHASGAKSVKHDDMLFNHAAVIRKAGDQACNYCHQKPSCARCHEESALKE
jgi:nitrate/TMAO reductase-like tetraheme cytochrome c subunit